MLLAKPLNKVARLIGLPYPGGPLGAESRCEGNPEAFTFPRARLDGTWNSHSAVLKTAVLPRSGCDSMTLETEIRHYDRSKTASFQFPVRRTT